MYQNEKKKAIVNFTPKYQFTKRLKLNQASIDHLGERRDILSLRQAKKCKENNRMAHMFPLNKKKHKYNRRNREKYVVFKANTARMKKSSIVYMQHLLNK